MTPFSVTNVITAVGTAIDGLTTGPDNNIWFIDALGGSVGYVTTTGQFSPNYSPGASGSGHQSMVFGPDGNLWYTEQVDGRLARMGISGSPVTRWNMSVCHPGNPFGLTVGPDGNLWIAEIQGNTIDQVTPWGSISEFPSSGTLTANAQPFNITTGPDGNIWFTELNANKVGKMSPSGALLAEYSMPSPAPALDGPAPIVTGPDGNLWVGEWPCQPARLSGCDHASGRLIKVSTSGMMTPYAIQDAGGIAGLAIGPDGNIWGTMYEGGGAFAFNPTTDAVVGYTAYFGRTFEWAITAGPDGNMYVAAQYSIWKVGTGK